MKLADLLLLCKKHKIDVKASQGKLKVSAPEGALTSEIKLLLTEHKAQLLEVLSTADMPKFQVLSQDAIAQGAPLSFAQKRLWFLGQLENSSLYNIGTSFSVAGALDMGALECSLNEIIKRHSVLRTVYSEENGISTQKIIDTHDFTVEKFHIESSEDREQKWRDISHEFSSRNFDLSQDLMLRVGVVSFSVTEARLMIYLHHIASDGWSLSIFIRELNYFYDAFKRNERPALPKLEIQYIDYANWQNEHYLDSEHIVGREFWLTYLKDLPQSHNIPLDKPRPAQQTHSGDIVSSHIPKVVADKVIQMGQSNGSTLFITLYSALSLLLAKYSGEDDIVIGTPIAGRVNHEVESLIGCFVNTLVLRAKIDANIPFETLLQQCHEQVLKAYHNQHVPFEYLVEELNPSRSLQYNPLFQLMFVLHNNERSSFAFSDVSFKPIVQQNNTSKFDLSLDANETDAGIDLIWRFATDIFDKKTIERLDSYFLTLLTVIVEKPQAPIKQLSFLPLATSLQLLTTDEDQGLTALSKEKSFYDAFEDTALAHQNHIALSTEKRSYTYQALMQEVACWQQALVKHQVKAGDMVGVYLTSSPELIFATLAIFKLGAVYVPLDPDYPLKRLQYMINDCQAGIIIAQQSEQNVANQLSRNVLFCHQVDTQEYSQSLGQKIAQEKHNTQGNDLAYVIYTSGSTGQPKGVMVSHNNVLNYYASAQDSYQIKATDRVLQFASPSFDIFIEELAISLLSGAALVLKDKKTYSSMQFWQELTALNVTVASLPTAYWHLLCSELEQQDHMPKLPLRLMILGGEKLSLAMLKLWQKSPVRGNTKLLNTYGPTETTVIASIYDATNHDVSTGEVPIGQAIRHSQCIIKDPQGGLALPGAVGELYVTGALVSQGYLNKPEQSKLAFSMLADVLGQLPAQQQDRCCYRTGDLVRLNHENNIEYIGRSDDQIKISGFRITIGEIEEQILKNSQLTSALVLFDEKNERLVAALTLAPEATFNSEQIIRQVFTSVKAHLPYYMRPSGYILLNKIPLTANGKIDKNLILQHEILSISPTSLNALNTTTEKKLGALWSTVLPIESKNIGKESNFFEAGGHSLLAAKLANDINLAFDSNIGVRELFEFPTIESLAARIEQNRGKAVTQVIKANDLTHRSIPASYTQRSLWYVEQLVEQSGNYNIAIPRNFTTALQPERVEQAIANIIARHSALRTSFGVEGGEVVQKIQPIAQFTLQALIPEGDVTLMSKEDIKQVILSLGKKGFDLSNELPIRVYFSQREKSSLLLLCVHHIVADGWSIKLFWQEFEQEYNALKNNQALTLDPLPIQFADYAIWQHEQLSNGQWNNKLNYWQAQLKDMPLLHALEPDFPRPQVQSFAGESFLWRLPLSTTKALTQFANSQNVTLFMLLQAFFSLLLAKRSNKSDIVIGSPVANRDLSETSQLIGFFANTIVLRTKIDPELAFTEYLQGIKKTNIDALENQDIPFDYLVEMINPVRDTAYNPLVQIVITLEQDNDFGFNGEDLGYFVTNKTAKFDLGLHAVETEQGLVFQLNYCKALFNQASISTLSSQLTTLLTDTLIQPDQAIKQLTYISKAERLQLFRLAHEMEANLEQDSQDDIAQLLSQQLAENAQKLAVACDEQCLTYVQLEDAAELFLQKVGPITSGEVIAVSLPRSVELVIVFYAILKAKAIYLPLDIKTPQSRLEHIVKDSGASKLIASTQVKKSAVLHGLWPEKACNNLYAGQIGSLAVSLYELPKITLMAKLPADTAYIIYTSGSTGIPKGVMITRQSILNTCRNKRIYQLSEVKVLLSTSNPAFDGSVFDLFTALLNGKGIVMIPPESVVNFDYWQQVSSQYSVNTGLFTTALFNMVMTQKPELFTLFKQVGIGGEQASPDAVYAFNNQHKHCRLYNFYGPTETSVIATTAELVLENAHQVPIGKPINGNAAYVLDEQQQLVPWGCEGELFIGGKGVGMGYLNLPEKSHEYFIANPITASSEKIYRTGDRVKLNAHGELMYLGRKDTQVKIRGHRIEVGEIEHHIRHIGFVCDVIVLVNENKHGDPQLECHIELTQKANALGESEKIWVNKVHHKLTQLLPHYMCPVNYCVHDKFSLTSNGKINRKVLANATITPSLNDHQAPNTSRETLLAEIWSDLLEVELSLLSRHSHFFELGGHSLLILKLTSHLKARAGESPSIAQLFNTPVLSEMAVLINLDEKSASQYLIPKLSDDISLFQASPAQRSLWLVDQMMLGSAHYNVPFILPTAYDFDRDIAEKAIEQVIARHQPLRTVFTNVDGVLHQKVLPLADIKFRLQYVDCRNHSDKQKKSVVKACLETQSSHQFDLSQDILLQAIHLEHGVQQGLIVFNIHHIAFDGWSKNIFCQDYQKAYDRIAHPATSSVEIALPLRYIDYTAWQHEFLQSEAAKNSQVYWQEQLRSLPNRHGLPILDEGLQSSSLAAESYYWSLPVDLSQALKQLSVEYGLSQFMLMHAGLSLLISRYSTEKYVTVGTPCANRSTIESELLIGLFTNTLVLKSECYPEQVIGDYLQAIKQTNLDALAHQAIPFEQIVELINPQRSEYFTPLFQIMLTMDSVDKGIKPGASELSPDNAQPSLQEGFIGETLEKFDMSVHVSNRGEQLEFNVNFKKALFSRGLIEQMANDLSCIYQQLSLNQTNKLSQITLASQSQITNLSTTLFDKNLSKSCIYNLFERQVQLTPSAIALTYENSAITYEQLNQRANKIAHFLIEKGAKPDNLIGLCLPRSIEQVMAILAILKSGAAYVPLDPEYPAERLHYIIDDAQLQFVITNPNEQQCLAQTTINFINIEHLETFAEYSDLDPITETCDKNLAYIIYTSGTTGDPKGVMIEHRNTVAMLDWALSTYTKEQLTGVLASTSICFDLSVFELFAPLSCGGTSIITKHILDVQSLACSNIKDVTLINTVPSAIVQLLEAKVLPVTVQVVNLAGEALLKHIVDNVYENSHIKAVYNLYGPSEDTTYSTYSLCPKHSQAAPDIGLPLPGSKVYILDQRKQIVPQGVIGELYITGTGLSRGYLNKPTLTADKFISGSSLGLVEKQLYGTGDLVRYNIHGKLEFVGRLDQQVKLNGFRIELGEIETAICDFATVKTGAVLMQAQGELHRLVAFVEPVNKNQTIEQDVLLQHLQTKLPVYMQPTRFIAISSMPLNSNGKVDRKALRSEYLSQGMLEHAQVQSSYLPARTAAEQIVVELWQQLLNKKQIGITDNFFSVGGKSILAIQVMNAINLRFSVQLSMIDLLKYPTIKALMDIALGPVNISGLTQEKILVELQQSKTPDAMNIFLIHPIGGDLLCYRNLLPLLDHQWHVYGLQVTEMHQMSLTQMTQLYIKELRRVQPSGPYHIAGYSLGGTIAYEIAIQLTNLGEEIASVALIDSTIVEPSSTPFDEKLEALAQLLTELGNKSEELNREVYSFYQQHGIEEALRVLHSRGIELGLVPATLTQHTLSNRFYIYESNLAAFNQYRGKQYQGEIKLIAATQRLSKPERYNWNRITNVQQSNIECDHYNIMDAVNVTKVAQWLHSVIKNEVEVSIK